jgi:hypothetical protein
MRPECGAAPSKFRIKEIRPVVFPRARAIAHCVRAAPRYIPSRAD